MTPLYFRKVTEGHSSGTGYISQGTALILPPPAQLIADYLPKNDHGHSFPHACCPSLTSNNLTRSAVDDHRNSETLNLGGLFHCHPKNFSDGRSTHLLTAPREVHRPGQGEFGLAHRQTHRARGGSTVGRWPRDPGGGKTNLSARQPANSRGHGFGNNFTHHTCGKFRWTQSEEIGLEINRIGDHTTEVDVGGARNGGDDAAEPTSGKGFRCCEGLAARTQLSYQPIG